MFLRLKKYKWWFALVVILLVGILCSYYFSTIRGNSPYSANNASHNSPLNPAMNGFFNQYDLYYTGWDDYVKNGQDLGPVETGSSTSQAVNLVFSKNATSTGTQSEITRKLKQGQTEGRTLTIMPDDSYVIEDYSPSDTNGAFGGLFSPTLLRYAGDTYTRDANSDYFVDQGKLVYVGCLAQSFDANANGNICRQFGLYVGHSLVDQTSKSTDAGFTELTISLIHNHAVYYIKYENDFTSRYYSYDLNSKTITALDSNDYGCDVVGFVQNKPVDVCMDIQSKRGGTNIYVGGTVMYSFPRERTLGSSNNYVIVVNNHVYYVAIVKPTDASQPLKVSLIRDGVKVAESEADSSQLTQYTSGLIHPTDGSRNGCLFNNDDPTPAFCIVGDNVISRSNYGYGENEYYINGKNIDFSTFYNQTMNGNDAARDFKKPDIWQLDFLPDSNGNVVKIAFLNLTPNDVYVSNLLPDATISKPALLISNVGGIVGAALK